MATENGVNWCSPAPASQRADWARQLAAAYLDPSTPEGDRGDIRSLLSDVAEDLAVSVRRALAEALAASADAPAAIVLALAHDVDSVAAPVLRTSPLLADADLTALARDANASRIDALLGRPSLSRAMCAALASSGRRETVRALLTHPGAAIAPGTFASFIESFPGDAEIRGLMADRSDLPADLRQTLMRAASEALASSPLATAVLGEARSARLGAQACERGTANIVGGVERDALASLIETLVEREQVSTAVLLRLACSGALEALTEALARLSGISARRVRAVLVEGRRGPFEAICERAALPSAASPILIAAVGIWRDADEQAEFLTSGEVAAKLMTRMATMLDPARPGDLDAALAFLRGLAREMRDDVDRQRRAAVA